MGKTCFIALYLLLFHNIYGQNSEIHGKVMQLQTKEILPGATVSILLDTMKISTAFVDIDGNYKIRINTPGTYTLVASYVHFQEKKILQVQANATKEIDLYISIPCNNSYSQPIKCPLGEHTDGVVPIIYGLPSKKMLRKEAKGKISLGGCIESCQKYYCKTHKNAF